MKMGVLAGLSGLRHHASSSFLGSRVSMHQYTRLSERTRAEDAVEQAQHARADQGRRCCHETTSACSCFAVSAVLSSASICDNICSCIISGGAWRQHKRSDKVRAKSDDCRLRTCARWTDDTLSIICECIPILVSARSSFGCGSTRSASLSRSSFISS